MEFEPLPETQMTPGSTRLAKTLWMRAPRGRAVREQALRAPVQLILDVDRLGQRGFISDQRVELQVARLRARVRRGTSGTR